MKAMKNILSFIMLVALIQSLSCHYAQIQPSLEKENSAQPLVSMEPALFDSLLGKSKNPEILLLPDSTELEVHYGDNLFYLIGSGKHERYYGYGCVKVKKEQTLVYKNRHVKTKSGDTLLLEFSSSDGLFAPIDERGRITFRRSGDFLFFVRLGTEVVQIPIRVVLIPLNQGMTTEEIIAKLGLPDTLHEGFLSWLDSAWVDDIHYYAGDVYGESYEHWLYEKFPKAVLRFGFGGTGELANVVMASWLRVCRE